ncbi:MAG TPA: dTMP kinase [Candidatus Dormibacteraeota bacterium]|nr:dTMP kinase [Candidatus Dormibacteraeota bacterium]
MNEAKKIVAGGALIMFEGIDGAGKTTQLDMAMQELQRQGWLVSTSRSPGGTPIGEALRSVLLQPLPRPAMTDLYIGAAIQESLIELIEAKRASSPVMLHDRGPLSTAAYQIYGSGIDESAGWHQVDNGMKRLKPDLIIMYECDPSIALGRISQNPAKHDYFEDQPLSYFERVAEGYKQALKRYPAAVVDASQPIEKVHALTMQHINKLLKRKN